jgi:superfamily II DNA or RNA helicase
MHIGIVTPTKAYVKGTDAEIAALTVKLAYKNTSKNFEYGKHLAKYWLKEKDFDRWEEERLALKAQIDQNVLQFDGKNHWVRPGIIPYIKNPSLTIDNYIKYPALKTLPWLNKPEFEPYPYQTFSANKLIEERHGCVSLPTGCGKSYIIELLVHQTGLNVVIVTPGESIFNELLNNLTSAFGKRYVGGYGDGKKDITKKITVAIGKSLTNLEPGTDAYDFFHAKDVMIIDESHTFAASTLEDVAHGVLADVPYRFFLSATQTRGDGTEKMLFSIIGECVMSMSIEEAIRDGYLCPLNFTILDVISPSTLAPGDPIENKREHFLYNKNIAKTAAMIANAKWTNLQESTLILVEELIQIKMLKDLLNVPFGYVHSGSKKDAAKVGLEVADSQEQVARFNRGEIKVLIGTKAIATGTNIYPTHNTINYIGGSSEIITKQGPMGRSTRKLEISKYKHLHKPKPCTMIYDFNVTNNIKLEKQLQQRKEWYKEAGGTITHFKAL